MSKLALFFLILFFPALVASFNPIMIAKTTPTTRTTTSQLHGQMSAQFDDINININDNNINSNAQDTSIAMTRRKALFQTGFFTLISSSSSFVLSSSFLCFGRPPAAWAATTKRLRPLSDLMYTILRVREATEQESRLIQSGKFKDVQRANIKLAVKFMVENYRLADALVSASAYIENTDKRIEAGQVGQSVVQNLLTILEYFDSSDVQNLKVGSDSLAGKEQLVLKGLESARRNIDTFLSYFPASEIDPARTRVQEENALNLKEFDPELGSIINLQPSQ